MKTIFAFIAILTFVGCSNHTVSVQNDFKTIMLKSAGEVETLPDMASFQINLSCLDKSIAASKECLVKLSNELNEKLLSFGIDQNDILTTSVNLDKSYTWEYNSRVFEGYRSSVTTYITVKNLDKLGEMYTELLENSNLSLGALSYTHSKIDSLQNEAYADALKNSGVLADRLLQEMPETEKELLKIGNVEITSSNPNDFRENDNAEYSFRKDKNSSIHISTGTVKVYAELYTEYLIK